eukprot:36799-Prymnesium_polylepis.1
MRLLSRAARRLPLRRVRHGRRHPLVHSAGRHPAPLGGARYYPMGQYLLSLSALLMRLTAPSAMHSQLEGSLTIVDDVPIDVPIDVLIVDLFFASTVAAQPVLIASLISMLLYAFALTTSVAVWAGRALPRDKFVEAASKGEIERARFDK